MGVYFDYFRAADDDAARATHVLAGGPMAADPGQSAAFDGVETKGVFPDPHLEQLVALATGTPYERGPRTSEGLWPPPETPAPVDETSLWLTDPSVDRLATRIREALADVTTDDIEALAERWAGDIGHPVAAAAEVIAQLTALARRAREAGQQLYCWSSL
jgi:hypothetical protein